MTKGQGIMSMLEQMARRLAQDALERVKPGTYTNVVDEIWLYRSEDGGKLTVSDYPHLGEVVPTLDSTTAVDTLVAMMAAQAGAIVVVPEDAPMNAHLAQIAQLLVNSADVPTDAQDVADGAAIVGTVKVALAYLYAARDDNRIKREKIAKLELLLEESRKLNATGQAEIERLNNQIQRWNVGANELQDKLGAAMTKIEALEMDKKNADTTIDTIARQRDSLYERNRGVLDAFRVVVGEMIEVGK